MTAYVNPVNLQQSGQLGTALVRRDTMTKAVLQKKAFNWGSLTVRELVYCRHGSKQTGVDWEQWLKALHPDLQVERERHWPLKHQSPPLVATSSNKATPHLLQTGPLLGD